MTIRSLYVGVEEYGRVVVVVVVDDVDVDADAATARSNARDAAFRRELRLDEIMVRILMLMMPGWELDFSGPRRRRRRNLSAVSGRRNFRAEVRETMKVQVSDNPQPQSG
jgi:hypothetical protein